MIDSFPVDPVFHALSIMVVPSTQSFPPGASVACVVLGDSVGPSVGTSVVPSVGPSVGYMEVFLINISNYP